MLTEKELEDIKAKYDYCIISTRNIVDIKTNDFYQKIVEVKPDVDSGNYMQFVNSDYFRSWGERK